LDWTSKSKFIFGIKVLSSELRDRGLSSFNIHFES
jgi:hypothetical protein